MKKRSGKPNPPTLIRDLRELKPVNFLVLALAGTINAFGVTLFLFPVKLYDSGISGLSMLLDQVTPPTLALSVFLLVLNVPIFLFGLKKQGAAFTVYSVYTIGIYSLVTYFMVHPVEGWTTTILFLSVAFFGLFAILTIIIKYLQLLLNMIFKRKHYSFESIEKLTK